MSQENTWIIVTGGSRGLGLGIIEDLLKHSYAVATCSKTKSQALDSLLARNAGNGRLFYQSCQVGLETDEEEFLAAATRWAGERRLHGLINNAGITGEGILATYPKVNIEEILRVNLLGAIRMARLVLRIWLMAYSSGRIINISSIIGNRGYTGLAAYSASKAGLDGLTRSLAREVGSRQITVNSIAPGYLDTEMSSSLSLEQRSQIIRRTPMGRLGTVNDVVPLVRFLLSEEASFINGQTISVDGGISC